MARVEETPIGRNKEALTIRDQAKDPDTVNSENLGAQNCEDHREANSEHEDKEEGSSEHAGQSSAEPACYSTHCRSHKSLTPHATGCTQYFVRDG